MSNRILRFINNTSHNEPLDTNSKGDILRTGDDEYSLRTDKEYHILTDNVKTIETDEYLKSEKTDNIVNLSIDEEQFIQLIKDNSESSEIVIIKENNAHDSDYTDYPQDTITMFRVSFFGGYPRSGTLTTVNIDDENLYQVLKQYDSQTILIRYMTWESEWSNWSSLDGILPTSVTEESPITDYQYGESVTYTTESMWSLGYGTIKTIRVTNVKNFGRQLFFCKDNDDIYTRRELDGGWTDWKQIQMVV